MSKNYSFWPNGLPMSLHYPTLPVYKVLDKTARRSPERTAIIFKDRKLSYSQLSELSRRFASAMAAQGVKRGDRAAVVLPNCPQYVIAYYGLLRAGAVFTPVSPLLTPDNMKYQLMDSDVETVVILDAIYTGIKPVLDSLGIERRIIACLDDVLSPLKNPDWTPPVEAQSFNLVLDNYSPSSNEMKLDPKIDLAHIAYTGGASGPPKGVMLTHFNVLANVMQSCMWVLGMETDSRANEEIRIKHSDGSKKAEKIINMDQETALIGAPWHHAAEAVRLNNHVFFGSEMVVFSRFEPVEYLAAAEKYKATYIHGSPSAYRSIINHPDFKGSELKGIKWALSGSAPLPAVLLERMLELIPGVITEGYGLAECSAIGSINPPSQQDIRTGSIGLPVFDTEFKVVDPVTGEEATAGEEGEICIKGPQVMLGYWNNPEETAKVLKDGWLHTGEIGREDEDGYFYITGRIKT